MLRARLTVLIVVGALATLVGCSSGDGGTATTSSTPTSTPVPTATELMASAATAMRAVTSAHFSLGISGSLPGLIVQSAEGDLTSTGDAQGKGTIVQFGQLLEVEFVFVGGDLYLKGPTGGFSKLPAALAGSVYDPTALLNPDKGVVKVLTSATGLGPVTSDGGQYTVTGKVPKDVAASLAPGIAEDVDATFTIDAATSTVSAVSFALTGSDGKPAGIQLLFSDLNAPVTVTAPS